MEHPQIDVRQLEEQENKFVIPMLEMPADIELRAKFENGILRLWMNDTEIIGVREVVLNGLAYGSGPNVRIRALRTGIEGIQVDTTWTFLDVENFEMQAKGVK